MSRISALGLLAWMLALALVLTAASPLLAGQADPDADGDGVVDVLDNCLLTMNKAPLDCDTDNDGYGNACDGDFDQNNAVTAVDFNSRFLPDFKKGADLGIQDGTDMDCNGAVTAVDFNSKFVPDFKSGKPGPSGLFCAGTVPCDL